jgi:hypothetical protein
VATKYTDAQIRKLFPTYFDAAATATQVDEDIIRKILKMYAAKEGGRTYIGNKLKLDQSVIGRIINKAIEKNILKKIKPAEFKTNLALKKYGDISERKIYKTVRPVEPRDYIKDPTIPKSAKFKAQVPSGQKKPTSTKMVYGTTEEVVRNKIKQAEEFTEASKIAKAKPFKNAVIAIHRIAMAEPEDLKNINKLSKMVYGADDVKNLTRTANDLVRYQEFLLGFRPISGINIPAGEKLNDIISEFPSSGQWGKFAAGAIRESKLKIRDQLLKTKGPKLIALRNKILKFIDSGAMELDEAMGVSATFERAPGYTELGQVIKKGINQAKRTEIDNPFSRLFEKVIAGETNPTIMHNKREIGIKEFNKLSREFQKINKVDTPIIEYRPGESLDASKFIKHFDKLSPEAKANVTKLANKGIALRSKAMPMEALSQSILKQIKQNIISQAEKGGPICSIFGKASGGTVGGPCGEQMEFAFDNAPEQTLNDIAKVNDPKLKTFAQRALSIFPKLGTPGKIAAGAVAGAAAIGALTYNKELGEFVNPLNDDKASQATVTEWIKDNPVKTVAGTSIGFSAQEIPGAYKKARELGRGRTRSALGITGALKPVLTTFGTPAMTALFEVPFAAKRLEEGETMTDVLTDPFGPALGLTFMEPLSKGAGVIRDAPKRTMAEGLRNYFNLSNVGTARPGVTSKILRMGLSPRMIAGASRFLGLPGLALSLGLTGYDAYKNYQNQEGMIYNFFNRDE